ncbi:RAMP superfamily CRISPR-associated protein [Dehalobacterium formicoaceticum]|uniref:CRISPR type III-associated protein domain-containing protein n=1 Tax=Dehalobacterium formicoaceticum TaxID=51515 RepID=A0ABT1Y7L2_9FIRM|nr:RAMP superfamily CRISPR-associated protein [Dehalobacterium formicoaceticum]MCR6546877.1 hypothetical protein [Dehalobacterium formicoaceticum]
MDLKLTIKITNLSFLLLGSGEGWSAAIDNDLAYDQYGFPYFPARRLKGLLRESAQEVVEMFHCSNNRYFKPEDVDECFGQSGSFQPSPLSYTNLFFENFQSAIPWLEWSFEEFAGVLSQQEVLNTMTQVLMQTAIDDNGLAREGSLRTCRVLKPGCTFQGEIILQEEKPKLIQLITLACINLRRVGSGRNRGLGEVACSLYQDGQELSSEIIKQLKGA